MGVWRSNLVQELAWAADFTISGSNESVVPATDRLNGVPSWSWASVNQKLCFRPELRPTTDWTDMVEIEDLIALRQRSPYNHIDDYSLWVRGRTGHLRVKRLVYKRRVTHEQEYYPSRCTFEPDNGISDDDWSSGKAEVALFDTVADAIPGNGERSLVFSG